MQDICTNGVAAVRRGEIAWIEIFDGEVRQTLLTPSITEIEDMCVAFGFSFNETIKMIRGSGSDIYGFVFDAPKWREECLKNSKVHLFYDVVSNYTGPICMTAPLHEWVKFDATAQGKLCEDCMKIAERKLK